METAFRTLLTILTLFLSSHATAQVDTKNDLLPENTTLSTFYYDGYLANRVSRLLTTDPSIWYQLSLKWKSGMYFNWLEIHGVNDSDWSNGANDETQISIGKTNKIGEYNLKYEATLINTHPIEKWFSHDRLSLDLYISRPFKFDFYGEHTTTPELRTIWFSDTNNIVGGVPIIMPSLTDQWDKLLGIDFLSLQNRVAVSWDGGLYKNSSEGIFLQTESSLQWRLGKNTTLTFPGYKLFTPLNGAGGDGRDKTHGLFFCGIKHKF